MTLPTFPTPLPGFTIRFAHVQDAGTILEFIRKIAAYEKMSEEVVTTEKDVQQALFSSPPTAEAVLGEYEGIPVSFAVFFHNFSTFTGRAGLYLEDLFVDPEWRGRGMGKILLLFLARLARDRGCRRFEWTVLDWNEPAVHFYKSLGAVPMDEWTVYRLHDKALEDLAEQWPSALPADAMSLPARPGPPDSMQ